MTEINLETKLVTLTSENNIAVVTLNNPPVNVLNKELLENLDKVFDYIANEPSLKVVVLTGAGKAFAAGADIKAMPALDEANGEKLAATGQAVFNKLENMPKASICALNGMAFGGGLELALSCDMRIFSDKASVGLPEITLGIMPGYGGTQRLTRLVGKPKAKELILTGDAISAQTAYDIGVANHLVAADDLLPTAMTLAGKIATKGQMAVKFAKKAIDEGFEQNLSEALKTEAQYFGKVCGTEDKNEGVNAFIEKRKPNFQDK